MHNNRLYIIENLTSLHVGSGETNFGVIDNLVQRDIITSYPTIHSSSLKGALKEFVTHTMNYPDSKSQDEDEKARYNQIRYVFGDDDQVGMVRFIEAHLLAIPMRSDLNPYYLCVSPQTLKNYCELAKFFGIEVNSELDKVSKLTSSCILVKSGEPTVEDYDNAKPHKDDKMWEALESIVGEPVAVVPNQIFDEFLEDLPVIARNQLDNGESKNLFYEEVVPRKSKFFTIVSYPTYLENQNRKKIQNKFDSFHELLIGDNLIQIGANASIGYGVCKFSLGGESCVKE